MEPDDARGVLGRIVVAWGSRIYKMLGGDRGLALIIGIVPCGYTVFLIALVLHRRRQ
jgi:hypothetical protein